MIQNKTAYAAVLTSIHNGLSAISVHICLLSAN